LLSRALSAFAGKYDIFSNRDTPIAIAIIDHNSLIKSHGPTSIEHLIDAVFSPNCSSMMPFSFIPIHPLRLPHLPWCSHWPKLSLSFFSYGNVQSTIFLLSKRNRARRCGAPLRRAIFIPPFPSAFPLAHPAVALSARRSRERADQFRD